MQKIKSIEFKEQYLISLLSLYAERKELSDQYKTLDFNQLGINSLGFIKLLADLAQKYKIEFSATELIPSQYKNIEELANIVKEKIKESAKGPHTQ